MAEQDQQQDAADADVETDEQGRMPDAGTDLPPEVREAVAERPAEVARFLGNLEQVNDLLDGAALGTAAMDDEMVQTLARTGTNLGSAADGLATPETARLGEATGENATELAEAIETLAELQRSGTLDDVLALADTLSLATAALDDEMVTNLAATGSRLGEIADTASDEEVAQSLESVLAALGEAGDQPPASPGVLGLARAMRDPEVKAGLGFLLAVAKALGRDRREA